MSNQKEKQQAAEIAAGIKDGALTREQVEETLQSERTVRQELCYLIDDDAILAGEIFQQKINSGFRSDGLMERAISTLDSMARTAIGARIAADTGGTISTDGSYRLTVRITEGDGYATADVKFIKLDEYKAREARRIQVNVDSISYGIRDKIFRDSKKGLDFVAIAEALKEQLAKRISRDTAYIEKQKQTEAMREFIADLNNRFETEGFDVDYTDRFGVEAKLTFTTKDKKAFEAVIAKLMPAKKQEAAAA